MIAYGITYSINSKIFEANVDAKNIDSAKKKIARSHNLANTNIIRIHNVVVLGYF